MTQNSLFNHGHLLFTVKFCLGPSLNFLGHLPCLCLLFFRQILICCLLFFSPPSSDVPYFCSNFNKFPIFFSNLPTVSYRPSLINHNKCTSKIADSAMLYTASRDGRTPIKISVEPKSFWTWVITRVIDRSLESFNSHLQNFRTKDSDSLVFQ